MSAATSKLYTTHLPTSVFQKVLLAAGSAGMAILQPQRGDMVATMGETTAFPFVLEKIHKRMEAVPTGGKLLSEQPRITNATIDREYLRQLPAGTFGHEYLLFLERLGTEPNARPPVRFIDDPRHLYIMQRYRETHDFNHVALGMPTTMLGEVTVKWFEAIQLGLPMCITGGLFGAARLKPKHRRLFLDTYLPWVIEQATSGHLFLAVDWENHWDKPLNVLMNNVLNVEELPSRG